VALTIVLATAPVACGGRTPSTAESAAEARFIALANAICRKVNTPRAEFPPTEAEFVRLRTLERAARKAPRVALLLSDLAARRKLRDALDKLTKQEYVIKRGSYLDQAYRLNVKVYADQRTLGLTSCSGARPRKPIEG
jgi:hypothetical protein